MAGRSAAKRRTLARLPAASAPFVGSAVLVGAVRGVETLWMRIRGVRPMEETTTGARLVHAALLTGALILAERVGLPRSTGSTGRRTERGRRTEER
jgi:hypothetical protein